MILFIAAIKFIFLKLLLFSCWVLLIPPYCLNMNKLTVNANVAQSKDFMNGKVIRVALLHVSHYIKKNYFNE